MPNTEPDFKKTDIYPVFKHYLKIRNKDSLYYRFFERLFLNNEILSAKIEAITILEFNIGDLSSPGELFVAIFEEYDKTTETKKGKRFSGHDGHFGIALRTCLENIVCKNQSSLNELKTEIGSSKHLNGQQKESAIKLIDVLHRETTKTAKRFKDIHQTYCFFRSEPESASDGSTLEPNANASQPRVS